MRKGKYMKRVLSKRIYRDFKANLWRYTALSLVIIFCVYLIISIVGAADTIMKGTKEHQEQNHVEDGEFETIVKLTDSEIREITSHDVRLEEQFYIDVKLDNGDTLRVFQNRENINLIELDEGQLASTNNEIVIEKRYSEENNISIGNSIKIDNIIYTVTGIATTPDYDAPMKTLGDTAIDSKTFGTAFVTDSAYNEIVDSGAVIKAETYCYSFILGSDYTSAELKNLLMNITIEPSEVDDECFQEYWDRTGGKIDELQNGIDELLEGSISLCDGLSELENSNEEINNAADNLVESYLSSASATIGSELTEDDYYDTLTYISEIAPSEGIKNNLLELRDNIENIISFRDGLSDYTSGEEDIADGMDELSEGIVKLDEKTDEYINDKFDISISILSMFLVASDNIRISGAANDVILNYQVGLIAGVIVMVLFTYVISVFVVHTINSESSIIGSLYALGATKRDLISHYITLPVIICFVAGLVGTIIGFSPVGIPYQTFDSYSYYSLPEFGIYYEPFLIIYGVIMPPLVAAIVNSLIIRKKLSVTALSLIRNEQNQGKKQKINLNKLGFIQKFQIRQLINEIRSGLAIVFGLFVSLLIVMMSLDCYILCSNIAKDMKNDTKFEYLYMYKFPQEELPEEGYVAYASTLKSERVFGYTFDTIVYGITGDNPYFELDLPTESNEVVISEQVHTKMNLDIGDILILNDNENNKMYAFNIVGITKYSTQLCCFMDIDCAREVFGANESEYNVVFSDKQLNIPTNELITNLSKGEIVNGADVFVDLMSGLVIVMAVASVVILILVMYLMMKVMIDRSVYSISLMKVFGYKSKNIKKLYINGNFYVLVIGSLISIPLTKLIMDAIFPYFVSNVAININLSTNPLYFVGLFVGVMILYWIISSILLIRINKIVPAEALKNRE